MKKVFRDPYPEEIRLRPVKVSDRGASWVPYMDARSVANQLDEYFDWEDEYERIGDTLFCRITIHTENGKRTYTDCGTPSNEDPVKGEASDAFKRAAAKLGIGRSLYTSPFIWVTPQTLGCAPGKDNIKQALYEHRAYVSDISFAEDRSGRFIEWLEIKGKDGEILYQWSASRKGIAADTEEIRTLRSLMAKVPGADEEYLRKRYKVNSLKEIAESKKLYSDCKRRLEVEAEKIEAKKEAALKAVREEKQSSTERSADPLDTFSGKSPAETETDVIPFESDDDMTLPENVIFRCSDEAPEHLLSYRGVEVGNLPESVIRELARKNAKARVTVDSVSLAAIEDLKNNL